jgi:diguanylate cyclase (GGDEF)-like protein/PAS domain S-box-containing protein
MSITRKTILVYILFIVATCSGLWLTALYSYLLFHSIVELFSIVVACSIFMLTWNARRFLDNHSLLFLGIAYLFVGTLDLLHLLSYKGMGVFPGYTANVATQLWIGSRYLQAVSLLLAPFFAGRTLNVRAAFLAYSSATFLLIVSIFYLQIFPDCYAEGGGLTPFKVGSEYVICIILLLAGLALFKKRNKFDATVSSMLTASILATVGSELSFTLYTDVYGFFNMLGHFLKIASFWLIYVAVVKTGLEKPYSLLFRELKQSEETCRTERDRAHEYFELAGTMMVVIDGDERVSMVNQKACDVLGYPENEVVGTNWFDAFLPERSKPEVKAIFKRLMDGEIEALEHVEGLLVTKRGEERIITWHNAILKNDDGKPIGTLSSGEDITDRRRTEEIFQRLAHYDTLTGLPNRALFYDRFNTALSRAKRKRERMAVMVLDLDRFKEVNDSAGHHMGDLLLKAVVGRVEGRLRASDTIARIGGDEFTILLPEISQEGDAITVARDLLGYFSEPFRIGGVRIDCTTSIGIAIYPEDGDDVETLLKNADAAMYRAKEQGRNTYVSSPGTAGRVQGS